MKKVILATILGLTGMGCAHVSPKPEGCTAAEALVQGEVAKGRAAGNPALVGSLEYCRVIPDQVGDKAVGFVVLHNADQDSPGVVLEDGAVVRFMRNEQREWVMLDASPAYVGVPLNPPAGQVQTAPQNAPQSIESDSEQSTEPVQGQ